MSMNAEGALFSSCSWDVGFHLQLYTVRRNLVYRVEEVSVGMIRTCTCGDIGERVNAVLLMTLSNIFLSKC